MLKWRLCVHRNVRKVLTGTKRNRNAYQYKVARPEWLHGETVSELVLGSGLWTVWTVWDIIPENSQLWETVWAMWELQHLEKLSQGDSVGCVRTFALREAIAKLIWAECEYPTSGYWENDFLWPGRWPVYYSPVGKWTGVVKWVRDSSRGSLKTAKPVWPMQLESVVKQSPRLRPVKKSCELKGLSREPSKKKKPGQ